jgi:hypothetical protein
VRQLLLGEVGELDAGDDRRVGAVGDPEVGGDPHCRTGMVAGDHQYPHPGTPGLLDREGGLGTGWIDDADHPQVDQLCSILSSSTSGG